LCGSAPPLLFLLFFVVRRHAPRSTLFPYTTLFRSLLHTTRLTRPCLHTLYDVYGNIIPRERTLPHLSGYNSSRPVRLGNAASEQDRKSTRLNSSHLGISYAVFCLKKKTKTIHARTL